jgi:hypothetical protein
MKVAGGSGTSAKAGALNIVATASITVPQKDADAVWFILLALRCVYSRSPLFITTLVCRNAL